MKKPNIEDYKLTDGGYSQKYITDLEKYCDKLEHELEVLKEEYNADQKYIEDFDTTKDWYWKKIKQLEKAVDKACIANKDTINDKVVRMINDLDLDSIKDKVVEIIAEKVIEMLNDKE